MIQRLLQEKRDDLGAAGGRAHEDAGATGASKVYPPFCPKLSFYPNLSFQERRVWTDRESAP